ncbi:N-acetylglucosamine kinase [Pedobacter alpinus]|uniref:N-acetylglucosamine kinase n=1 Tax=Pedobacter alpinus TaxID=1590643 RepID=A0ABW5TUM7_9SPHI
MLLVADGGSSKTDWILQTKNKSLEKYSTSGLNPFFWSEKEIVRSLNNFEPFNSFANEVTELHFFGAGCSSPDRRELISNALTNRFKNAFIAVESDLLGSAIACCKDTPGFSCILGTESNISFYNGQDVESNLGLGYVLGEEGSGTYFGKKLITDFIYKTAPKDILAAFDKEYQLNKETVIKNLYQKAMPNYFLASFAQFMSLYYDHPYIQNLLTNGFHDFIKSHILRYSNYKEYYCHFVGSIGFHFQEILKTVTKEYEINTGIILEKPIDELFDWIKKREGF